MPAKEERIRARAYELWEREGRAHGGHERHWLEATRQVEAEMADETGAAAGMTTAKPVKKAAAAKPPAKRAPKAKTVEPAAATPKPARSTKPKAAKPA
jgi:hypothetical protein